MINNIKYNITKIKYYNNNIYNYINIIIFLQKKKNIPEQTLLIKHAKKFNFQSPIFI